MKMLFNKKTGVSGNINVESAYMLWRSLVDRNITSETYNILKNYIYDSEFRDYLKELIEDIKNEKDMLNKLLGKFNIVGPDPSPSDQNTGVRPELIDDQLISEVFYRFMRLDVNLLMLSMKETPTDVNIFDIFMKLVKSSINRIDSYIRFAKSKNWIYIPPVYRHVNSNSKDIAINGIALLWDHLVFRYNNIRLTQIASVYAQDKAFEVLLTVGIKILQKQAKEIEEKLLYYGVVIPKAYPSETVEPNDKEMFEDRFMFNLILRGMQDAVALHGSAIQEVIRNDDLRKFFIKLTFNELSTLGDFTKFGLMKGWVNLTPGF